MAGKLMHAVQYTSYGGGPAGLKHVEVSVPAPKDDEVLLKIEAVSINPIDWKLQKGIARPLLPRKFPFIPLELQPDSTFKHGNKTSLSTLEHQAMVLMMQALEELLLFCGLMFSLLMVEAATDVAGEVVTVGSGVKNFKTGDKVVSILSPMFQGHLSYQQLKLRHTFGLYSSRGPHPICRSQARWKRPTENHSNHCCLWRRGHFAVQLAKLGNTHVTATCGVRNLELVKSLGADEVLITKHPMGPIEEPSGRKYDAVIHVPPGFVKFTCSKKRIVPLLYSPKGENLEYLVKLVKEGKLKTVVDSKYPLSKAEDAWAKSIDGHATGKIVVEPQNMWF
ncbi:hypothetical protein C3L33_04373, partial [Rhododendron williamsianum]